MFKLDMKMNPSTDELLKAVRKVEKQVLDDLSPYWRGGGKDAAAEEMTRIFATEGYGTWAPLSGKYAKWKQKRYPGKTILRREDAYFRALSWKRLNIGGNLFIALPDQMEWGVDLSWFEQKFRYPYPAVHEYGNKAGTLPARSIIPLAEESQHLENAITKSFTKYIEDKVRTELSTFLG